MQKVPTLFLRLALLSYAPALPAGGLATAPIEHHWTLCSGIPGSTFVRDCRTGGTVFRDRSSTTQHWRTEVKAQQCERGDDVHTEAIGANRLP